MVIFEDIMINKKIKKNTKIGYKRIQTFCKIKLQLEKFKLKKILFTFYHKKK